MLHPAHHDARRYNFVILPQYFASGTTTRMAICLVMHPIALESAEAFSRLNKSGSVLALLRKGKLTPEKARCRAVENSMDAFILKVMMAFYRRMQVLIRTRRRGVLHSKTFCPFIITGCF